MTNYNELYDWFQNDILKPAVIKDGDTVYTFIRVPYDDDFDFIYYQDNYNGQRLTPTKLDYGGIYNKLNGLLYDVQYPLSGNLDEIDSGKSSIDLMVDFEKDVRARVEELVDENIDSLKANPFVDEYNPQRLEAFKKNYAPSIAREMFLKGELCEDLRYRCEFSTDRKSTTLMMRYLNYPTETVEEAAARYWLTRKDDILLELRKNEIIRDAYREIEANPNNPLYKQRAIIDAVSKSGAKTVNVSIEKNGESYSFKYSAERFCRISNYQYSEWDMAAKDRPGFEELFGKYADFRPEDIASISYRGKTLYEADTFLPDDAEDEEIDTDASEDEDEGFTMSM